MKSKTLLKAAALIAALCFSGCSGGKPTHAAYPEAKYVSAQEGKYLFTELQRIVQNGDPAAHYYLGMLYNNGLGTEQNPAKAYDLFLKAAAGGDPLAHYKLGCYYHGQWKLLPVDMDQSLEQYRIAAEAGYAMAQHDVAVILAKRGKIDEAIAWLETAAEQGEILSIAFLFRIYATEQYGRKDDRLAYFYLKLALHLQPQRQPPPEVLSVLEQLGTSLTAAEKEKVSQQIAAWQSHPTNVTIRGLVKGIDATREYVKAHPAAQ